MRMLPINFPQTFMPERALISIILEFAAKNGQGSKTEIRDLTGIPSGESTGKVEPIIHFANGMGLLSAHVKSGKWQLGLSPLGLTVFQEDCRLSEPQTLWLLHLMLCRRVDDRTPAIGIADAWFALFAEWGFSLGKTFKLDDFIHLLTERHGSKTYTRSLASVVVRSYLVESCSGSIGVLKQIGIKSENTFERCAAPSTQSYYPVYAAYLYIIWDDLFATEKQIDLNRLAAESRMFSIMSWQDADITRWLEWMVDKGVIQLDRYTGTAMLLRLASTEQLVRSIYSELL